MPAGLGTGSRLHAERERSHPALDRVSPSSRRTTTSCSTAAARCSSRRRRSSSSPRSRRRTITSRCSRGSTAARRVFWMKQVVGAGTGWQALTATTHALDLRESAEDALRVRRRSCESLIVTSNPICTAIAHAARHPRARSARSSDAARGAHSLRLLLGDVRAKRGARDGARRTRPTSWRAWCRFRRSSTGAGTSSSVSSPTRSALATRPRAMRCTPTR